MTSLNEPADVLVEEGPPESFKEASPDDEDTLVSERVVSSPDKIESAARMNVDLMLPVVILAPELAITVEKVERLSDEVAHGGFSESDGSLAGPEEGFYLQHPCVLIRGLRSPGNVVGVIGVVESSRVFVIDEGADEGSEMTPEAVLSNPGETGVAVRVNL